MNTKNPIKRLLRTTLLKWLEWRHDVAVSKAAEACEKAGIVQHKNWIYIERERLWRHRADRYSEMIERLKKMWGRETKAVDKTNTL